MELFLEKKESHSSEVINFISYFINFNLNTIIKIYSSCKELLYKKREHLVKTLRKLEISNYFQKNRTGIIINL